MLQDVAYAWADVSDHSMALRPPFSSAEFRAFRGELREHLQHLDTDTMTNDAAVAEYGESVAAQMARSNDIMSTLVKQVRERQSTPGAVAATAGPSPMTSRRIREIHAAVVPAADRAPAPNRGEPVRADGGGGIDARAMSTWPKDPPAFAAQFTFNYNLSSVQAVYNEYAHGIDGKPAVRALNTKACARRLLLLLFPPSTSPLPLQCLAGYADADRRRSVSLIPLLCPSLM